MTRPEIIRAVEAFRRTLGEPLPPDELAAGWSETSRLDMLRFFEKLEGDLRSGADIPYFSLGRILDGYGIDRGSMLEEACRISVALSELGK